MTTTTTTRNEITMASKTTTTKPSLDEALAALDEAKKAATAAERQARELQAAADDRRARALAEFDRRLLDDYDPEALDAEIAGAHARLLAAVEADPVYSAMAELAEATGVAYHKYVQADAAARQLGVDTVPSGRAPAGDLTLDPLLRHVTALAAERARTAGEALTAERAAAGDTAAEGA